MSESADRSPGRPARKILLGAGVLLGVGLLGLALARAVFPVAPPSPAAAPDPFGKLLFLSPRSLASGRQLTVWWDDLPTQVKEGARILRRPEQRAPVGLRRP